MAQISLEKPDLSAQREGPASLDMKIHHHYIIMVRDGIIRSVFLAARFKLRQAKRALTAKYIEVFTA